MGTSLLRTSNRHNRKELFISAVIPAQAGIQQNIYPLAPQGANSKGKLNKTTGFPPSRE
jgi:hypothetical protein